MSSLDALDRQRNLKMEARGGNRVGVPGGGPGGGVGAAAVQSGVAGSNPGMGKKSSSTSQLSAAGKRT